LSKGPPGAYRDHDDLHALLKELGVERAHILGLSMGGRIALDFALEYPAQVSSVIAVAPGLSGYEFKTEELEKNREQQRAAYRRLDYGEVVEHFQRAWTDGPHRTPEEVDPEVRSRVRAMALWGFRPGRNMGRAQWPEPPAIGRLAQIGAPVLAIVGDQDMSDIEAIVEMIAREVPGAEKAVIPGAGHMVNMEQPTAFSQVVLDFLSRR
jgi:pimeloyl-ACP methyl ester carboxylesterase